MEIDMKQSNNVAIFKSLCLTFCNIAWPVTIIMYDGNTSSSKSDKE